MKGSPRVSGGEAMTAKDEPLTCSMGLEGCDGLSPHHQRGSCWFCKGAFVVDALIAGYDTFDEQRLACLACNERMQGNWRAARHPEQDRDSGLRAALEQVEAVDLNHYEEYLTAAAVHDSIVGILRARLATPERAGGAGLDVETMRATVHAVVCDPRSAHDMGLGRCADAAKALVREAILRLAATPTPTTEEPER
jgi:hypothetical protein